MEWVLNNMDESVKKRENSEVTPRQLSLPPESCPKLGNQQGGGSEFKGSILTILSLRSTFSSQVEKSRWEMDRQVWNSSLNLQQ